MTPTTIAHATPAYLPPFYVAWTEPDGTRKAERFASEFAARKVAVRALEAGRTQVSVLPVRRIGGGE